MAFNVSGSFPASIIPSQNRMALSTNYLDFTSGAGNDFGQQYLPELYEQEVERYGNRTLSGFLRMVGAEMPMTSDQVVWSEQNRLHIAYKALVSAPTPDGTDFRIEPDISAPNTATSIALRKGNTILMSDNATGLVTQKFYVKDVLDAANAPVPNEDSDAVKALITPYDQAGLKAGLNSAAVSLFVYGSEFAKGTNGMEGSIEPEFTQYSNKPIIIKDKYEINGSDTAQIGWVEVATEDGTSGYLWYLKAQSETRLRFDDYLEMAMVEAEDGLNANLPTNIDGSEGMFAAIEARGNVYVGFSGAAGPGSGAIADFDEILKNLDKQGAIEENMLFLSRQTALDFDDMIAAMNGGFASTAAASYGLFDNEAEMALNFGFTGFRRGSYDFYKTDWKYLNDASTRGLSNSIDGVLVPAGTTTVYDQMLGSNIRRPFLHVRYRASETDDRRYKSWITGSVGGAYTSDLDAMSVHFLSERCLVTQAANNFVLFKAA
tara:strand:+ start:4776 stop:6245 length:1470 start_codon:yes stop_codon:yes gene_type:complete